MERILSAREFHEVLYRGLPDSDPLAGDLKFKYRLWKLWCMECDWAAGRAVTGLALSGDDVDLLAVGYGKYLQQDQAMGLVCLWSAKNPKLPERLYRFASAVTALRFSPASRPNLLAVATLVGKLALPDVSAVGRSVVADAGAASGERRRPAVLGSVNGSSAGSARVRNRSHLRRKTYLPASRTAWAWPAQPTTLPLSHALHNLLVGDRDGGVVAFALRHMPFALYFQTQALVAALHRALATKPAPLAALRKLGPPFAY